MARSPYREVWHLMAWPDFSRVERGEDPPPWVNQRQLDFEHLRQLLADGLMPGSANIRVATDTIDQVTVQFREQEAGMGSELMRCKDLADRLRKEASKQSGNVIDVSRVWANRQYLTDRNMVPPPIMLPVVVESHDFEDMMMARMNASLRLGMLKEHPIERMARQATNPSQGEFDESHQEKAQEGRLPSLLKEGFEELFGIAYKSETFIDFVSHDPLPKWARNINPFQ